MRDSENTMGITEAYIRLLQGWHSEREGCLVYRLFIVDDDMFIRESLRTRFDWTGMGYEIAGLFEDGSDVIALLEEMTRNNEQHPDVILTDIVMFQQTGLDVAEYVMRHKLPVVVILLSGYQEFEYAVKGIQYRIYDYLLKPVDPQAFRDLFIRLTEDLKSGSLFPEHEQRNYTPTEHESPLSKHEGKVKEVKRYIREHLAGDLSVNCIACNVFMSARQLQRLFTLQTGQSIGRYIHDARMKEAERLLLSGLPVERVAESVGFSDVKYFRRVFAESHGCSISEFGRGWLEEQ